MNITKPMMALLLLMCSAFIGVAQEVTYSAYDKFDYHNGDYAVVGMTGGILYTYRNSPSDGALLDAFDDSMNKTATILLDFFPIKIYHTRFISYTDRIIALYQGLEGGKVVQYAALLDQKARLKNRPVEIASVKTGIFGAMKDYYYSAVSDDKKSIFVYSVTTKGNSFELDGKWLDDSIKVVRRCKATFKADDQITFGEVNIANDGTIYMAAYTTAGARDYADRYWILTLKPGATSFEAHPMELSGKYATSGYMKIDNLNGKVYFGGFYSDKKSGSYDGIIYSSYNTTTQQYENTRCIPLDNDLAVIASRKRNNTFDNFDVRQLISKNDGGFVLVSEVQYITTRTNFSPGMGYYSSFYSPYSSTYIREFHYNDIMALSYNKDGVKEWNALIPKQQYSQEDNGIFSSYLMLNSGGTLAFLFNDFNTKHSRIQLATLDASGKTETNTFTAEGNDYPDWLPRAGKQVAARILIVPCLHKRQICFAKVVF